MDSMRLVKAFEDRSNLKPHAGVVAKYLNSRNSEKTALSLQDRFMIFIEWAEREDPSRYFGYSDPIDLPIDPEVVARYAEYLDERGLRISTIQAYVSAIGVIHKVVGFHSPISHPLVKRVMDGLNAKNIGTQMRRARALSREEIGDVLRNLPKPRRVRRGGVETAEMVTRRTGVDKALLLTMVKAGLRSSEASGLMWQNVQEQPDGSGQVSVRSNIQNRGDSAIAVDYECIQALIDIRPPCEPDGTRVFGLSGRQIARRLKRMCEEAGIDPDTVNGHTPRATLVRLMIENGAPIEAIQRQCRLFSPSALDVYYKYAHNDTEPLKWLLMAPDSNTLS